MIRRLLSRPLSQLLCLASAGSALLLVSPKAAAQEEVEAEESSVDSRGQIAIETRAFLNDDDPGTRDVAAGLFARVEWTHDHSPLEERLRAFTRVDRVDLDRSILVVEEAWVQLWTGPLKVRAGIDTFNWTATEAFHPADVINARNADSDLEAQEKVGEPNLLLALSLPTNTNLELYALPAHMASIPPSQRSRLNPARGVPLGGRILVDREGRYTNEDFGPQAAVRIRQVWGPVDLSVHALEHMDRTEPAFAVEPSGTVRPVFFTVRQLGGTYQQAIGGAILKLEGVYRSFVQLEDEARFGALKIADHGKVAFGLDYTLAHEGGGESTLMAEAQAVLGTSKVERLSLTPFQRDVLGGYRFAFNDQDGKELLVTGIFDLERRLELLMNVAYQQRLGETWSLKAALRIIYSAPSNDPRFGLAALRDADFLRLTLARHF